MGLFDFLNWSRTGDLERKGPARRRQQQAENAPSPAARRQPRHLWLAVVIAVLLVWSASIFGTVYQPVWAPDIVVGMPIPHDLYALVDFAYVDTGATAGARTQAANRVEEVYRFNRSVLKENRDNCSALFAYLTTWREDERQPQHESSPHYRPAFAGLDARQVALLRGLFDSHERESFFVQQLHERGLDGIVAPGAAVTGTGKVKFAFDDERFRTVEFSRLATPRAAAMQLLTDFAQHFQLVLPTAATAALADFFGALILPNLAYDEALTSQARSQAMAEVAPITRSVRQNALLLKRENDRRVSAQDKEKIDAHRTALAASRTGREFALEVVQQTGWSLLLAIAGALLLGATLPQLTRQRASVLLAGLVIALNLLLVWGTNQLALNVLHLLPLYVYPALPVAFGAILLSLLLGPGTGMAAGLLTALLAAIQGGDAVHLFVLGAVGAVAGALAVRSARTRLQTFRAVLYVPVAVFLVELTYLLRLVPLPEHWLTYLIVLGLALAACIANVILANLVLPFMELFFGCTTNIALLELSDLNHPLLKRLSLEAPGTYTHTMMVATLAEHAAQAIGANPLLARVASYFHDIGKLANPDYFTENSFDRNLHADLSPKMSSLIILNHVKEGLALAARYKLRAPIREAIATHHGTSLVIFFYQRAKAANTLAAGGGEHEFRYPGPRPRSAEATIIGLADVCEAASRSLEKPTPQKIDTLVNDLFNQKLDDGQLDNSDLTMAELHTVRESVKKTLRVMLHGRIAYPKPDDGATTRALAAVDQTAELTATDLTNRHLEAVKTRNLERLTGARTRTLAGPADARPALEPADDPPPATPAAPAAESQQPPAPDTRR